jgi:hypothetical protein
VIPVPVLLRSRDNAELADDGDDGVLGLERNRAVVECNNLALGVEAMGNNLDDEVLDNLLRGIISARGVIGSRGEQ